MPLIALYLFFSTAGIASVPPRPTCATAACHNEIKNFPYLHGPNKANGCNVCHQPGTERPANAPPGHAKLAPLESGKIKAICQTCHDDKVVSGHPAAVHDPFVNKDCTACHNPHGSTQPRLLKTDSISGLCFSCHKDLGKEAHGGHESVLTTKRACLQCHEPHMAEEKKLLRADQKSLCLGCHNQEIHTKAGETLINVSKQLAAATSVHKPVREGKCSSCHNQHGSTARRFLRKPFDESNHALCLECHKEANFTAQTSEETQFRNGTRNLHDFHLRQASQAISCKTCHDPHASEQDRLIRTRFDFNGWQVPIRFAKTPSGGTCTTACHGEKRYDRNEAVHNNAGR